MPKKASGRGTMYTPVKKPFLVLNVGIVKPISEGGWDRVHAIHLSVYAKKNRTVESLCRCFTNLRSCKAPSGDPTIPVEICARTKCGTGSSKEEEDYDDMVGAEEEEDEDGSQELLGPNMVQTLPTPSKKGKEVIKVEHEDSSMSEDSTDMSAFKALPFKKAKLAKKKDTGKGGSKEVDEKKKGGKG
eukprot:6239453-Ditylum_brightwellii.AAC.1